MDCTSQSQNRRLYGVVANEECFKFSCQLADQFNEGRITNVVRGAAYDLLALEV